jgi:hypothetical protein
MELCLRRVTAFRWTKQSLFIITNWLPIKTERRAIPFWLAREKGMGIQVDECLAVHCFKLDIEYSSADACCVTLSADGKMVPADKSLAGHYFKLTADQGNIGPRIHEGNILQRGDGIPADNLFAVHDHKLATDQRKAESQSRFFAFTIYCCSGSL